MPLAIFGYGSLMDEENLKARTPGARHFCVGELQGWRLVFDKPGITHRYLNLEERPGGRMPGVIIYVTDAQFADLARREVGYHVADVTAAVTPYKQLLPGTRIVAFVHLGLPFVRMSYLNRCLRGVPPHLCEGWLQSVDFQGAAVELDEEPICGREALERCGLKCLSTEEAERWFSARSCADLEALRRQA